MSDSKNIPKPPPPDDFSKTTPNIPISEKDKYSGNWGKTDYHHPAQPPADDWGNTVANYRPQDNYEDFGDTYLPASNKPKVPDWGITQANVNIPDDNFGGKQSSSGEQNEEYGATTPYFRLPEAERAKYQNIPPTPTQEAELQKQAKKEKGGVPPWLWISGGLLSMFLFAVFVLLVVFIFFFPKTGFEASVVNAPPDSRVLVNGAFWGVASQDGSIKLPVLKAGETKKIEIQHLNYICEPEIINGTDGVDYKPIKARCMLVDKILPDECGNIKAGAYDLAEKCANEALDNLSENFSVDDLLRAMNLYIIQFDIGKYDIPPKNMAFLEKAAGYMKKLPPEVKIEVGGHTDNTGTDESNQILSDNRAKAVRDALIKLGIKSEMLTEKGYGSKQPKATNDNEDGRFQNRRIEYSAVKK
ncbi:MAG: OmpA family protein [Acidobacteriota bacterium]